MCTCVQVCVRASMHGHEMVSKAKLGINVLVVPLRCRGTLENLTKVHLIVHRSTCCSQICVFSFKLSLRCQLVRVSQTPQNWIVSVGGFSEKKDSWIKWFLNVTWRENFQVMDLQDVENLSELFRVCISWHTLPVVNWTSTRKNNLLNIILTFQLITASSHVMLSNTFVLKRQNFFVGPTRAPNSSWQTAKYVKMDNISFKRMISNIPSGCSYLERIRSLLAFLFVLLSKLLWLCRLCLVG